MGHYLGLGSNDLGPLFMPLTLLVSENWISRKLVNREGRSRALVLVPSRTNYLLTGSVSRVIIQPRAAFRYSHRPAPSRRGAAVTKIVKILLLVAILTVTLAVSPAQACACHVPDWSVMSAEEIVSAINGAEDEPRIMAGQSGELPAAPPGYRYDENYRLVPL